MRSILIIGLFGFCVSTAFAQSVKPNLKIVSEGKKQPRTEFVSYDLREDADKNIYTNSQYFIPVTNTTVKIPFSWLDRDVFVRIPGSKEAFELVVNSNGVGYTVGNKQNTEFDISKFIVSGNNTIQFKNSVGQIISPAGACVFSQPKVRIDDFVIKTTFDSTEKVGVFNLDIIVSNSYNVAEELTVYYDLMDRDGKVIRYNYTAVNVPGQGGTDTVKFEGKVPGVAKWSAETPNYYQLMMRVKYDDRFIEYIPFAFGFVTISYVDNQLKINGKSIKINAIDYTDAVDITKFIALQKKKGVNTLILQTPQSKQFYQACMKAGIYVIDALNSSKSIGDDEVLMADHPSYLPYFQEQAIDMIGQHRNYTPIIGWSLGDGEINGYNYKKTYQLIKNELDVSKPVIYLPAQNSWNNDKL